VHRSGHVWGFGRWLGAREVVYQLLSYATVLALALIIGTRNLGGLRSAEALFSPFSLIAAALVPPALPALSRAAAASRRQANRLAFLIGFGATALGIAYFLLMALAGSFLLTHLFGRSFSPFEDLVWPMAVGQLFFAAGFSFNLLLSAEKRGPASFVVGVAWSVATFACATGLAAAYNVTGAAWGMAFGAGLGSVFAVWLGLRRFESRETVGAIRPTDVSTG
jgi:O-antigen/teichoic acid export membrane protein